MPVGTSAPRLHHEERPKGSRVLVLIPAMNEEENLGGVLDPLVCHFSPQDILVVDDGSSDRTPEIAAGYGCKVVSHLHNLGYGSTLLTGYHYALLHDYDFVVQLDGDGQHPPELIPRLLDPVLRGESDVVVGSRYLEGKSPTGFLRRLGALPLSLVASLWIGARITDPTSGFQALSKKAVLELCTDGFPDDYPDIDVLIHLHRKNIRIREVPVAMRPRLHGQTMHGGWKAIYYYYRMAVCLLLMPIRRNSPYRRQRPMEDDSLGEGPLGGIYS
ncbi:MAG TPA: glycosyltransferase family 2 protein [Planctomycetes bacterium]|nr:glycosyltransferase family 2 protein [Planctomycetota bacterium]